MAKCMVHLVRFCVEITLETGGLELYILLTKSGEDPTCEESVELATPWPGYSATYHKTDQVKKGYALSYDICCD